MTLRKALLDEAFAKARKLDGPSAIQPEQRYSMIHAIMVCTKDATCGNHGLAYIDAPGIHRLRCTCCKGFDTYASFVQHAKQSIPKGWL